MFARSRKYHAENEKSLPEATTVLAVYAY